MKKVILIPLLLTFILFTGFSKLKSDLPPYRNSRLKMEDRVADFGPVGVRWGISTAYPSGVSMAATCNLSLIYKVGQSIGRNYKNNRCLYEK